jgi:alpha-galactosidase
MFRNDGLEAWKKPLSGDRIAIALFNRNARSSAMTVQPADLELDDSARYNARGIAEPVTAAKPFEKLSATLSPHETKVFILSKL